MNAIVIKSSDVEKAKEKFGIELVTDVFTDTQSNLPWDLLDHYTKNNENERVECLRCLFGENLEQMGGIKL